MTSKKRIQKNKNTIKIFIEVLYMSEKNYKLLQCQTMGKSFSKY